jgi:hypothetical protein
MLNVHALSLKTYLDPLQPRSIDSDDGHVVATHSHDDILTYIGFVPLEERKRLKGGPRTQPIDDGFNDWMNIIADVQFNPEHSGGIKIPARDIVEADLVDKVLEVYEKSP